MSDLMEEYVRTRFAAEVTAMQNAFDQRVLQANLSAEQQAQRADRQTLRAQQAQRKLAVYMLEYGESVEFVSEITEMPIETVQQIAAELGEYV